MSTIIDLVELVQEHWGGTFCGNPRCLCATPGPVCEEWMGGLRDRCARCGWDKAVHQAGWTTP